MGSLTGIAGAVLLIAAGLGALAGAASRQASRRYGAVIALAALGGGGLLALDGDPWWLAVVLAAVAAGFWLFDRGIPGNRPRPGWLRLLAIIVAAIALAVVVLTVSSLLAS